MDNSVKIVLIIMIALVLIVGVLGWAWVYSPTEFTIIFEVEDATLDVISNFTEVLGNESNVEKVMNDAFEEYLGDQE